MLADVVFAEPHALIGYAATRALQENAGAIFPEGAHTAESHLARGLVDAVVPRPNLRDATGQLLDLLASEYQVTARRARSPHKMRHTDRPAWQLVQLSRHEERPTAPELLARMVTGFVELRGDRMGEDDPTVVAGIAALGGETVMVIGQNRAHGKGLIRASGFRKATRAIRLAAKFNLPIVVLLDSAGPEATLENEESGLAQAIASCTAAMLSVRTPTVAVITGEGASEAASAMGAADRVLMLDNAIFEVVSPEAAARMVLQEAGRASEMAESLRITSHDCLRLGIIDATVPEPAEGAHTDPDETAQLVSRAVLQRLAELRRKREKARLAERYQRYRQIGTTHGSVRGRLDRRIAHLRDRYHGAMARLRRQPRGVRRWNDSGEEPNIPL
jgi:acetyl-CoA carboxylase carboxyl transferase subunit beta